MARKREKKPKHGKLFTKIKRIYHSPGNPGSFGGVRRLAEAINANNTRVTDTLKTINTYTLHKQARRHYPSQPTITHALDNVWQMDLADTGKFSTYNEGVKYLLFIIDTYSRHLWVRPLKSKTGKDVADAINDVFQIGGRVPGLVWVDMGKEFLNTNVNELMKAYGIKLYFTGSQNKASMVERVQRTLKERLYRYFTYSQSFKYIHVLQQFVLSYNRSVHRSTGHRPIDSLPTPPRINPIKTKHKYAVGQTVRINKIKPLFAKSAEQSWSNEIFEITDIVPHKRVSMYKLKDSSDCQIKGAFVNEEIQPVPRTQLSEIRYKKP